MELEDLKRVNEKSIRSAGPRYTPGLDADAPNLDIKSLMVALEGLVAGPPFKSRILGLAKELEEAFARAEKQLRTKFPRRFRKPTGLLSGLAEFASIPPGKGRHLVRQLRRLVKQIEGTSDKISAELYEAELERRNKLQDELQGENKQRALSDDELRKIERLQKLLHDYQSAVSDIQDFLMSSGCKLKNNNLALLVGEWGTGKTHFLCDFSRQVTNQGIATLLVLAKDFEPHPGVGSALAAHTGLCSDFATLIEKLNEMGAEKGLRSILIIDGINENDHRIWRRDINTLRKAVQNMPYVGLVLSCRQPFEHLVVSEGERRHFVTLSHHGFADIEFDAQSEFFHFYDIPLPEVPLLAEEFSRPLTLKIMCEAFKELPKKDQRKGFAGIASGQRGMTFILEKFINKRAQNIEAHLNLPGRFCWNLIKGDARIADPNLAGLAPYMAENMRDFVPESICLEMIQARDATSQKRTAQELYGCLIAEGVLVEDIVWSPDDEGGSFTVVRLPYQRFGDHLIARHLLGGFLDASSEQTIRRSFYKNSRLGRLFVFDYPHFPQYEMEGWVEALIVEFPERVKNVLPENERELLFYLPKERQDLRAYFSPFIGGMFWRNPSAICAQTDKIVGTILWRFNEYEKAQLLEALLAVATKPDHPYHGARLFLYLEQLDMVDRDLLWSEYVRKRSPDSTVERLIQWFETHIPESLEEKSALNLINILSLLLTTTDRLLRDRATKVLVLLGERFPKALFDHTVRCLSFNDPYVPERMLAASYGVTMSLWADKKAKEFHDHLPVFAKALVREIFLPGGGCLTHHSLIRDYALGIIELARRTRRGCIAPKYVKYIRRPFPGAPDPFPEAARIRKKKCKDAEYAIHMDFENYTIGNLVSGRANYDMNHPDYREVRRKIQWRIYNLGYRWHDFELIDQSIGRENFWRERSERGKADRYGKKYSWIAYFEMHGLLQSQGKLPDYRQHERVSDCDIDPSFPIHPPDWRPPLSDLFGKSPDDELEWIQHGPTPNYDHLLELDAINGIEGPWVLLDGYIRENDGCTKREVFSFLRGLIVDKANVSELEKRLVKSRHPGSDLPDPGQDTYTFAGEVPWSARFAHGIRTGSGKLRKIREEAFSGTLTVARRRRLKEAWKHLYEKIGEIPHFNPIVITALDQDDNGTKVYLAELNAAVQEANSRVEEKERLAAADFFQKVPNTEDIARGYQIVDDWRHIPGIPVELTSWYYGWESYHSQLNTFLGFRFPSPQICEALNLVGSHRSIELKDQRGRQATVYRESRENNGTKFELLYLREDLLNLYLKQGNRSLVWIIWGERQFHYDVYKSTSLKPEVSSALQAHEHVHKRLVHF